MTALSARGLSVVFGGVRALDDVDLDIPGAGITGLIGPNGAGKSTFIDAVGGFLPRNTRGRVEIDGRDVSRLSPHRRARAGFARSWQTQELFEDISVAENLAVAARHLTPLSAIASYWSRTSVDDERVTATLELLDLTGVATREPRDLSPRDRKLVGIARAIVGRPAVVCLDEPAAGLDHRETEWLGDQLLRIADSGVPVLLVDHDMSLVLRVCSTLHVLAQGQLIAAGEPGEVTRDPAVVSAYLGSAGTAGGRAS